MVFLYAGIALGMVNTVLRTRALTPEEIGVIGILLSISAIAGYLVSLGMPAGILKFYSRFKSKPELKSAFVLLCIAVVLVLFALVSTGFRAFEDLLTRKYDNPLLGSYISYVYYLFLFNGLNSVLGTVLRAEHQTVHTTVINRFLERILFLVFLSLMLVFPGLSFTEYFLFFLAQYAIKTALFVAVGARRAVSARPAFLSLSTSFIKELATYNSFMLLSGLAGVMTAAVDKLMLGYLVDLDAVGVYAIVITFPMLMRMIGTGFGQIAQPVIADHMHSERWDEIKKIYNSNMKIQVFLGGAFLVAFATFGEEGLEFLGEDYAAGFWVMIFLATGEYLNIATGMCGTIIAFSRSFRLDFYLRFFLLLLAIATNFALIPVMGITGAAIATASSLALYNIVKVIFVYAKFGLQPYDLETLGVGTYTLVTGGLLWGAQQLMEISNFGLVLGVAIAFVVAYVLIGAFLIRLSPAVELIRTLGSLWSHVRRRSGRS